ncbi:MAG: LacI family DNA-binding transcriptional regulator [Clostridia bacterium]|nr:LacI family DNA-binding transcriptional regulator [Clostridia bacterium]
MAEKQGKVTIYDVAALAGVSVSSVSRVLHGVPNVRADVRQQVEKAIEELDYVPNRTAQMLKTRRAYMLVHIVADVTLPFYITLHRRLRQEAEKRGYQMILFDADKDGPRVKRYIQQNADRVDGLICSARSVHEKLLEAFNHCGLPVVFTHDCAQDLFDACYPDPRQGAQLCMDHLLSLGHRRIAFVGSEEKDKMNCARLKTYRKVLADAGIETEDALIWREGEQMNAGYRAGMYLAGLENPPTAIYTSGDLIAAGVIQAMHDLKWDVPGEMSVTGENDLAIARDLSPALTTVTDPADAICTTVIDYLLDRVEGRYNGPPRITEKDGRELIVRGSTAKKE